MCDVHVRIQKYVCNTSKYPNEVVVSDFLYVGKDTLKISFKGF